VQLPNLHWISAKPGTLALVRTSDLSHVRSRHLKPQISITVTFGSMSNMSQHYYSSTSSTAQVILLFSPFRPSWNMIPSEKSGGLGWVWSSLVGWKRNHQNRSTKANASQKVQPHPMMGWAWLGDFGLDWVIAHLCLISPNWLRRPLSSGGPGWFHWVGWKAHNWIRCTVTKRGPMRIWVLLSRIEQK